jgi:hypothetical protein
LAQGAGRAKALQCALRQRVREAPFRPLATAVGLPDGWRVMVENEAMLHAVVETIYPGAVADWAAAQESRLTFESLPSVLARQTGQFRAIELLDAAEQSKWVERICRTCVCYPTWADGSLPAGAIPCAEACNWWLSQVLEAR